MRNTAATDGFGHRFTIKILIGMMLGIIVGLVLRWLPLNEFYRQLIVVDILKTCGQIFINLIRMIVVPIVLVSLICGASSLGGLRKFGRIGGKSLLLYLGTTALAVTMALFFAHLFEVGKGMLTLMPKMQISQPSFSLKDVFINLVPSNPFKALSNGNVLQIIIFSLLFGITLTAIGEKGKKLIDFFQATMQALIRLILMIMKIAPYGVFFLLSSVFAEVGFSLIQQLFGYFVTVLGVLLIQLLGTYTIFLLIFARLNPLIFFRKMYAAMLFAFSVSSSNASIPIVLETVEFKLGVKNSIASFIVPLGSTINMDGTAIMQGVATVFIANLYHLNIGLSGYFIVILMATLASIGTAGVPSVGLLTLTLVLAQVGLPAEGIGIILGVDRLLDMARTAVNVAGDSMISVIVGKSENSLNEKIYYAKES